VWLDELQRYLDGEHGLTGGAIRALLNTPDPAVIIGTIWPDRYATYTTLPTPGGADPHAREREVLDLVAGIRIAPEFSPAEQDRARAAAARDRRLAVALGTAGYAGSRLELTILPSVGAAALLTSVFAFANTGPHVAWSVLAVLCCGSFGAAAVASVHSRRRPAVERRAATTTP